MLTLLASPAPSHARCYVVFQSFPVYSCERVFFFPPWKQHCVNSIFSKRGFESVQFQKQKKTKQNLSPCPPPLRRPCEIFWEWQRINRGSGGGDQPGGEGRIVKPSELPGFYWPILLSTKVNDPGREPQRAASWWACTFLSTFIYDCTIKL